MARYLIRRLLTAIPTLLAISFVVFAILDLAPNDPTGNLPMTIPPEVREQIRQSLGLGQPFYIRYLKWLRQFFVNEPLNILDSTLGVSVGDSASRLRVRSWATRSPVVDLIIERTPQTLWVVGLSYIFSIAIAPEITTREIMKKSTGKLAPAANLPSGSGPSSNSWLPTAIAW